MTRIGSLFTGYGGLDMATREALGGETVWHSDIKPAAVRFLEHRHPGVPNLGDIKLIDFRDVPPVDVLIGGWPCQPHSSAGKRLGEADPRALWPEVVRAVQELRPRMFLGENVARVASNGELRRVVRSLAEIGYVGSYRTLRASDVGAPHRRDRLFIVAVDAAADAAGGGLGPWSADHQRPSCAPTTGRGRPTGERPDGYARSAAQLDLPGAVTLLPTPAVADSRNTRNATAGRSEGQEHHHSGWTLSDVAYADRWGHYASAVVRWENLLGRPAPDPTQPGARTDRAQLAPAFVEWMMGLPAGWVADLPGLTRSQRLSMLGDGVVPAQAAAAYRELLEHVLVAERAA